MTFLFRSIAAGSNGLWGVVLRISLILACMGIIFWVTGKRKARIAGILATAGMVCISVVSVVAIFCNITTDDYATGLYSGYHQLYTQNDNMWGIECKSALAQGSFRHKVSSDYVPRSLTVDSSSVNGTLILNIKQDGITESYNISNTEGRQIIGTDWLKADQDVQFSVEHTTADEILFEIAW